MFVWWALYGCCDTQVPGMSYIVVASRCEKLDRGKRCGNEARLAMGTIVGRTLLHRNWRALCGWSVDRGGGAAGAI